jgi:transposase
MVVVDGQGLPVGKQLVSASPHETRFIETTLDQNSAPAKFGRLIYDRAADSNALRQQLTDRGVDLIAPENPVRKRHVQDRRKLRRYRRRWKVQRTIAWLGNYRRLVVRYENKLHVYSAFFHLACAMIVLSGEAVALDQEGLGPGACGGHGDRDAGQAAASDENVHLGADGDGAGGFGDRGGHRGLR